MRFSSAIVGIKIRFCSEAGELCEGDGIVVDSKNKSVLEYFYGHSGIKGFVYNGAKYYFRRNVQGDVTRIYAIDGSLTA